MPYATAAAHAAKQTYAPVTARVADSPGRTRTHAGEADDAEGEEADEADGGHEADSEHGAEGCPVDVHAVLSLHRGRAGAGDRGRDGGLQVAGDGAAGGGVTAAIAAVTTPAGSASTSLTLPTVTGWRRESFQMVPAPQRAARR